jgi:hypothetical protein
MRPVLPIRPSQSQPLTENSTSAASDPAFRGFKPLTAELTELTQEITELKMPGLTEDLRKTLRVLARETIGDARQGGGTPCDFKPMAWARWMELLDLQSINAVRTRLARLEEMGLIMVLLGERGPRGATPHRFRLRWANDARTASRTLQAVLNDRARQMSRKHQTGAGAIQVTDSRGARADQSADPQALGSDQSTDPLGSGSDQSADSYSLESSTSVPNLSVELSWLKKLADLLAELIHFYENKNKKENQSASQSVSASTSAFEFQATETQADLRADNHLQIDLKLLLKRMGSGPWPELLISELGRILSPHQVSVIEERSPWSADGAWAILEAIRVLGHDLDQKAGTLWNALLKQEKGVHWLAKAGPWPARAAGDGLEPETGPGSMGRGPEAHEQRGCPPSPEKPGDVRPGCQISGLRGVSDAAPQERKEGMIRKDETQVQRPENFSPQMKAQLRSLIGHSRQALSACLQGAGADNRQGLDAFSKAFQRAVDVLEPALPLQVTLPDEHRPTEIRQRSQIKTNVLTAVFHAVS